MSMYLHNVLKNLNIVKINKRTQIFLPLIGKVDKFDLEQVTSL